MYQLSFYKYLLLALFIVAISLPVIVYQISSTSGNTLTFKARPINDSSYLSRYYQVKYRNITEAHFELDQFELNRLDNRKLLKKTAIPTIAIADFPRNEGIKRKRLDPSANETTSPIVTNQDQEHLETNSALHSGTSADYSEQNENDHLKCLQNELRAAKAQIQAMQKQINNLEEKFKMLFSEDQIHLLKYGNHRGTEWSNETIQKSLKLYMACGSKGYEELIRQKFPLPSIRTLQLRIENLKFKPGLLEDVFELLKLKIYIYIKDLVQSYTFFCNLITIGKTAKKGAFKGLPIYLLTISSGFPKPIVLIIGGINANDWMSTTSILYIANQLLSNCSKAGQLITTYDWHFIPILNPDGYYYSQTSPSAIEWIKNIARWSMDYQGVNLDFNFDVHFVENYNYNEDTYPGIRPFSEEESRTLRDYIQNVKYLIEMVIIFKTPLNYAPNESTITYPWSHTSERPSNWVVLQYLAVVGARAAENATGTKYRVIQSGELDPDQSGRIDDWLLYNGISRVLTVQTKFVPELIVDPYGSIVVSSI